MMMCPSFDRWLFKLFAEYLECSGSLFLPLPFVHYSRSLSAIAPEIRGIQIGEFFSVSFNPTYIWMISSSAVRQAVFEGLRYLLDNHLSQPVLKSTSLLSA